MHRHLKDGSYHILAAAPGLIRQRNEELLQIAQLGLCEPPATPSPLPVSINFQSIDRPREFQDSYLQSNLHLRLENGWESYLAALRNSWLGPAVLLPWPMSPQTSRVWESSDENCTEPGVEARESFSPESETGIILPRSESRRQHEHTSFLCSDAAIEAVTADVGFELGRWCHVPTGRAQGMDPQNRPLALQPLSGLPLPQGCEIIYSSIFT